MKIAKLMSHSIFCLFVISISRFGFKSRTCLLIAQVPVHCFSITLAIFNGCTARFVSDLVGNSEDRVSHNEANI